MAHFDNSPSDRTLAGRGLPSSSDSTPHNSRQYRAFRRGFSVRWYAFFVDPGGQQLLVVRQGLIRLLHEIRIDSGLHRHVSETRMNANTTSAALGRSICAS